ncbi:MAG: amidohydrolase family protein [Acidimicrobiia bacterium]
MFLVVAGITVDIHSHVVFPEAADMVAGLMEPEDDPFTFYGGEKSNSYNAEHFRRLLPKMVGPDERLLDMDRMGIQIDALSIGPSQYYYWTEPSLGAELAELQNDGMAGMVAAHPHRFVGMATLPMQDVDRAVAELERVISQHGFPGVSINTNVNGKDYDHPDFLPFFAKAQELDITIVLHPNGFSGGERLSDYYLINVIGNPLDSTVAVSRLVFGGVLERFGDLKIVVVHGGGYLPFYSDRMDHAFEVRPECREAISAKPSEYLRRLYFDTMVFGDTSLGYLVSRYGADHVLLGTDYPYDMGETDPIGLVKRVPGLSPTDVDMIKGGNAARLLRLKD